MTRCRTRRLPVAATLLLAGLGLPAAAQTGPLGDVPAGTAPPRLALVIGNAAYAEPLPGCADAARLLAQALEARGHAVTLRQDLSHGQMVGAFRGFARQLAATPGASGLAYLCGRAVVFEGRPFLLPVSARLARPADVISQGLLAGPLAEALGQAGPPVLLAIDAAPGPVGEAASWLAGGGRTGLAVALPGGGPQAGPAPLATALAAQAADSPADRVAALQQMLGGLPGLTLALRAPAEAPGGAPAIATGPASGASTAPTPPAAPPGTPLIAMPATTPAPPVATSPGAMPAAAPPAASPDIAMPTGAKAILATPPAAAAPAALPEAAEPPPDPTTPPPASPQEAPTNLAQRRFIQDLLRRLGYYDGPLNGQFGPAARAAIRRYQRETGAEPTGLLTAAQARRLLATQRATPQRGG